MRHVFLAALLAVFLAADLRANDVKLDAAQLTPGTKINLNGTWSYKPGYDKSEGDSGYVPVPVPQILNQIWWWLDDSDDFKKDEAERLKKLGFDTEKAEDGWYRKVIELPETGLPKGQRLFIQFDGVAMRSDVYINGVKLGHHDGMFSRFEYELTTHVKPGRNVLTAFVSMEKIPPNEISLGEAVTVNLTASKVLSMSKGMFGPLSPGYPNRAYDLHGIWQPVRLVVTGPSRIRDVWFQPSLDSAKVEIEVESGGSAVARLEATITDLETGQPVGQELSGEFRRSAAGDVTATLEFRDLKPKLWTPAEPKLYRLNVIIDGGSDRWSKNVGFRTFEAKDGKFFLNGRPYWIRGANQLPYGKNPTDPAVGRKLIQLTRDANINMTRTHCTPWNEAWLTTADEIGLGVSVEGIRPWGLVGKIGPTPPDMFKHWLMEQENVIKRIRNHPSVLIHTIGNEMTLRDDDNVAKWKQLSEVTQLTRKLDPLRPIVVSSTYVREKKQYDELFAPAKIDDGDIDDPHSYKAWYANSPFVTDSKFKSEFKRRADLKRPYMGQEFSSGYPDLDTGLPVLRYTRDLLTPQAWVGVYAYPGNNPKWFLEYNRAVTKRWAEQLRFQREDKLAGVSLFSLECWFSHGYDAARVKPYPVVEAVRQAFAPVGLALETNQRRFYADGHFDSAVFITNDDEQGRDHKDLSLEVQLVDPMTERTVTSSKLQGTFDVPYYATLRKPIAFAIPRAVGVRQKLNLVTRLLAGEVEVSRTVDPIEVFAGAERPSVPSNTLDDAVEKAEAGETAIVFAPDMKEMLKRFPDDLYDDATVAREDFDRRVEEAKQNGLVPPRKPQDGFAFNMRRDVGEFVDWTPARGTKLVLGLEPMDLRWWGRKDDWKAYVSLGSFRLKPTGKARELFRYIPAHGYIPAEKVPWQMRTVLFEIPVGKGRLWVCNLDLAASVGIDPVADIVARNLVAAAADPDSTKSLRPMPSHDEMLKGILPN